MEQEYTIDLLENVNVEDSAFKQMCWKVAEDIKNGILTFMDFILLLNNFLTNDSPLKRERGITVVNEVLKKLPPEFMTSQEIRAIAEYYTANLSHHHQGLPCTLQGILTLIEFENFPGECVPDLLKSIFRNVSCQQQQRADRYKIYCIFHILSVKFQAELVSMKLEYVQGVMNAIDGERDPKNLLFLFKWLRIFFSFVSLGHLSEDMFETIACYFPVDYTVPVNSNSPTRDDLAEALLPCLCAIPDFGKYCIPLALEKSKALGKVAILDSLKLLRKGCLVFEISLYIDSAPEICLQLLQLIFSNIKNNPEVVTESLQVLSDVIKKISEQDENEQYKALLSNIIDTVKGNLLPASNLFKTSIKILVNAALGSKNSTNYVLQEIVPLLTNVHQMTIQELQKVSVLKSLVELTECYLKYHEDFNGCKCFPELARVPSLCLDLLKSNINFKKEAYNFLAVLVPCLSTNERLELYPRLKNSILIDTGPILEKAVLDCLKALAKYYFDEVKEKVLSFDGLDCVEVDRILHAQSVLGHLREHRDYVSDCFLHCLRSSKYATTAVENIMMMLRETVNDFGIAEALVERGAVDILIELGLSNEDNINLVRNISETLQLLIGPQKKEIQEEIVIRHLQTVYSYTLRSENNIMMLNGIIFRLRQDVNVMDNVLELSFTITNSCDEYYAGEARELLANLINKYQNGELLNTHLSTLKQKCLQSLNTQVTNTVPTIAWITKALLMRNHPQGIPWLDWLLGMIEKYTEVLDGLKIIMNDSYDSTPNCHFIIMSLYKQKAFTFISNRICENYKEGKTVYLNAMGSIMEFIPAKVFLIHFSKISRIILLCLEKNNEPEILQAILSKISFIACDQPDLIESHLEDFLTRILKLTLYKQKMGVRIAALETLTLFSQKLSVYRLIPSKTEVLTHLNQCLDDRKRLVRQAATKAISSWYLVEASE
nr:MMS19 nucleotide excision repair protein homolog isoform X1 [Leptinotarsa decemlineata]